MSNSNDLTCSLAFLGDGREELNSLVALKAQIRAPLSYLYSTKQQQDYRSFACDYCVLYPATASIEVTMSLVSCALDCQSNPKIILLLLQQNTAKLEKELAGLGTRLQIIRLESPDILRAVDLINSHFILEQQIQPPHAGWEFVGASPPVHTLYDLIRSFARWYKDPILISGETGTGKELIARHLHEITKKGNFCAYNGAAIPLHLAESLFFGHVKGAFTDATSDQEGYIVKADNGTLFIDEIGDVEPAIQVKLLRTLQERTVVRLGDDESNARKIDSRFIFATNRELTQACKKGTFREDLFHRISALQIDVPPLRERKTDIPLLVRHFLDEFCKDYRELTPDIDVDNILRLGVLFDYEWTGNVRELRNVVRQAAAMTGSGAIDKKLAALVENKMEKRGIGSLLNDSASNYRAQEQLSFMSSLLDETWSNAESRFEKTYNQALFLKANGNYKSMMRVAGLQKTAACDRRSLLSRFQFQRKDLLAAGSLAMQLKEQKDSVSAYIGGRLSSRTRQWLKEYTGGGELDQKLLEALIDELNCQLLDQELYQLERFQQIQLSEGTQELINQHGVWTDLFQLNRMLIEDAYPHEIMKRSVSRDESHRDE